MKDYVAYFSILHEDFKTEKYLQRNFIAVDLVRHLLLTLEVVLFYKIVYV